MAGLLQPLGGCNDEIKKSTARAPLKKKREKNEE